MQETLHTIQILPVKSALWNPLAEKSAKKQSQKDTGQNGQLFAGNPLISKGFASYQTAASGSVTVDYKEGDRIIHTRFGEGTVKTLNEKSGDYEVCVDFDNGCTRKMMASFAKLKKI